MTGGMCRAPASSKNDAPGDWVAHLIEKLRGPSRGGGPRSFSRLWRSRKLVRRSLAAGALARFAAVEEARPAVGVGGQLAAAGGIAEQDAIHLLAIGKQAAIAGNDVERQAKLAAPILPFGDDVAVADFLEHLVVQFGVAMDQLDGAGQH